MNPAASIISRMGGVEAVAAITGRHISRVYRWTYPVERGGTGGEIPRKEARKILAYARDNGIGLSAEDFLTPLSGEAA